MKTRKGILVGTLAAVLALGATLGATTAEARGSLKVRSGEDLAAKIIMANSNPRIKMIKCIRHGGCDLKGTLPTYTGSQHLKIDGKGSTIDANGITDTDVFASTGGGSLKLMRLNFIGGMSGIYVEVPADKKDSQRVELYRVSVRDAQLHGVHISDVANAEAGVRLVVHSSEFVGNGLGADGQDGIFVDETGAGRVTARVLNSLFSGNGSDGLSLDEQDAGDVVLWVAKSRFIENGPNPANPNDLDDGLDIDETGDGDVWVMIHRSRFNGNFDDGIDLDERGEGTIYSLLNHVEAIGNHDQGVTIDERLGGNFFVTIKDSTVIDNDAASQQIDIRARQDDDGTGSLTLKKVTHGEISLTGVELITNP
jgi:hypothetical protein